MKIGDIYAVIDKFAPFSSQSEWDNSGILIGSRDKEIDRVGFALDANIETLKKATELGCGLLVTHHPVIFHPLKMLDENDPAYYAAVNGINVMSVHTPFDKSTPGVNTALAGILELENAAHLRNGDDSDMCVIGETAEKSEEEFASFISEKLGGAVKYMPRGATIRKVCVCGGAGSDFISAAKSAGADALVTGEVKHHEYSAARECGITIYAAGHYDTEFPSIPMLRDYIAQRTDIECILITQEKPVSIKE